ncbi:serine hydrolase domain-containing protein [Scleromatobacter humisilvae]|uniref:Beta-lactamase family protein n=1 Tax=Scleromatobacter humisilvae TaxID=2897159 RepID=A0A9X1YLK8_9BURK|nr:serine hydrolase [Scleromatobacter humisilvae]MCK9688196.1 beta-lactamase family protein [Scleromatobacter humisilvae]
MPSRRSLPSIVAAGLLALLAACGGNDNDGVNIGPGARTEVTPDPNDQWTLVAPASVGMDAATLMHGPASVPANSGVSSMLVMRHGQPVFEQYWNGFDKDTLHDLRSATKSITSLLVGIAIDQHDLGGVDDTISRWLGADYPGAPVLSRGLVLENLLTMRSGLACNDWDGNSPGFENTMYAHQDWVAFWLGLPSTSPPDAVTSYCTGNPVALGHILANATHQPVTAFAQARLLGPLGITSAVWNTYDNDTQTDTGGHMHMRPRDMAKIGQLALQRGQWNGVQLVSSAWMDVSTSNITQFDSEPNDGYGYLWWHGSESWRGQTLDMFYADGSGGQYIFVVPQLDLVAVFTGENYANDGPQLLPFTILQSDIVAAVTAP